MNKKRMSFKLQGKDTSIRQSLIRKFVVMLIILCFVLPNFTKTEVSFADVNQVTVFPDYIEEIVRVTSGTNQSTKFYMSTDDQKTWELIDDSGVVDISNILTRKSVTLYFKGNKDTNPAPLILPQEDTTLQVNYRVVSGSAIISFTTQPVEYKKGEFGAWKTAPITITTSIYEIKGATLYFRTPATTGKRAGKVVTVKIAKRPAPPSVKLDVSKLSITGVKAGETQYRVGDNTAWSTYNTTDTSSKSISLLSLLSPSSVTNTAIPAGRIELRTAGNEKKVNSAVKVIEVTQQPTVPDTITLAGTTLSIIDPDTRRAYEYTKVVKGAILSLDTAKWTTITSKNAVIVKNTSVGDRILVRLKSTTNATTKQPILASTYREFIVTGITIK